MARISNKLVRVCQFSLTINVFNHHSSTPGSSPSLTEVDVYKDGTVLQYYIRFLSVSSAKMFCDESREMSADEVSELHLLMYVRNSQGANQLRADKWDCSQKLLGNCCEW